LNRAGRFEVYYVVRHANGPTALRDYRVVSLSRNARTPFLGYVSDCVPLYQALRRIKPDVIYQRVACGYTGICALYARRHRARMVWHIAHDTDVMPQSLDTGRNLLRSRLEKWSVEFAIPRVDIVVAQTNHQTELLQRYYGRKVDAVVANFHPQPQQASDKSGSPSVVWIANLKPWKRPEIFVRLARALRDLEGVRFVMVGAAPAGPSREPLMQSIRAESNLTYLGHRPQSEVNELLAHAWILVNTSVHEGFPNTFIQAWLHDAVLASAVRSLLLDASMRTGYVERAREYVRSVHSLRNADKLVELIEGTTC